jgi:hypothetical protein
MSLELGDRVRIKYGVLYRGHDLTGKVGIIKNLESYVEVYLPDLNLIVKMFQHEVESYNDTIFDEITREDIEKILF